jgi:hypothetical protein
VEPVEPLDPQAAQQLHERWQAEAAALEERGVLSTQPHWGGCWCCCDDCEPLEARVDAWEDIVSGTPDNG